MPDPAPYQALALQVRTESVGRLPDRQAARAQILRNIARISTTVRTSTAFIRQFSGTPVRLVVLPEYVLTGAPAGPDARSWRDLAALEPGGPEYRALGSIAADGDLFLAGNAYEADPNFPELFFQCSFVIGPGGEVVLRYRRLISLYSPSPYDVWDRYLALYGPESVFPVVDTAIGRIGAIASEEILYPEVARCLALRGAEVLVHSTSEMGNPRGTAKELARRARPAENLAYLVSANTAGVPATGLPSRSSTAMSKIVDYEGRILAESFPGESMVANATVDLGALRSRRRRTGLANTLVRLPLAAFAASYASADGRPANQLGDGSGTVSRDVLNRLQQATIERLADAGLI